MNDMDKFFIQAAFKSLDEIDSEENKPIKKALLESRKREKLKRCAGNPELNARAFNHATDVGASSPSTGLGEDYNSEGAAIEKESEESIEGYRRRLEYACEDFSADGGAGRVSRKNRRFHHKPRRLVGEDYDPKHNRYDLKDPEDVEKAKRVREESDGDSDLVIIHPAYSHKKPRPGNAIISCKACEEVFYLDKSELEQSADDPDLYNADMRCENCGAEDGYDYIGDVAEVDTPSAKEAIAERESDADEFEEPEEEPKDETGEETEEESGEDYEDEDEEEEPEELVEESFDRLINKYAKSVYENFESYRTTSISQTGKGEYLVEGYILSLKGGKRRNVSFTLTEAYKKNGHTFYNCQNKGLIETTAKAPLRFSTKQEDKKLIFESLKYRYPQEVDGKKYLVEGIQIHG